MKDLKRSNALHRGSWTTRTSQKATSEIRKGVGAAATLVLAAVPTSASAISLRDRSFSGGILVGDPYFAGVVGETELHPDFALQLHGGTNLDDFCGGGRLLLKRSGAWEPYLALGAGIETRFSELHPIGIGSVGLRIGNDRARVFVELNKQLHEQGPVDEIQWSVGGGAGVLVKIGSQEESAVESVSTRAEASSLDDGGKWGAAVGVPYTIAVTHERWIKDHIALEGHAGTVLAVSSVGGRVIHGRSSRSGIYGFAGGGVWLSPIIAVETEEHDSGLYPYAWAGGGARFGDDHFQVFAEAGLMLMEKVVADGSPIPTIAGGLRF